MTLKIFLFRFALIFLLLFISKIIKADGTTSPEVECCFEINSTLKEQNEILMKFLQSKDSLLYLNKCHCACCNLKDTIILCGKIIDFGKETKKDQSEINESSESKVSEILGEAGKITTELVGIISSILGFILTIIGFIKKLKGKESLWLPLGIIFLIIGVCSVLLFLFVSFLTKLLLLFLATALAISIVFYVILQYIQYFEIREKEEDAKKLLQELKLKEESKKNSTD